MPQWLAAGPLETAPAKSVALGTDAVQDRPGRPANIVRSAAGDSAVAIVSEQEKESLLSPDGFYRVQLEAARKAGAKTGLIYFCRSRT